MDIGWIAKRKSSIFIYILYVGMRIVVGWRERRNIEKSEIERWVYSTPRCCVFLDERFAVKRKGEQNREGFFFRRNVSYYVGGYKGRNLVEPELLPFTRFFSIYPEKRIRITPHQSRSLELLSQRISPWQTRPALTRSATASGKKRQKVTPLFDLSPLFHLRGSRRPTNSLLPTFRTGK